MNNHPIVHVELPVRDLRASVAFYAALFGWGIHHVPEHNYAMHGADDGPGVGFPTADADDVMYQIGGALVYVGTDDIDASLARAVELGGMALVPRTQIPGAGWFGVFSDPAGNRVGLFTKATGEVNA